MLDQGLDQAAGLRRMVAAQAPTMNLMAFPVALGGDGAWIATLAHSLRAMGMRPVVLDASRGTVTRAFGMKPRHELLDMMRGAMTFDEVAHATADGVYVLRAERGVEAFVSSGAPARQLFSGFAQLSHGFDSVLLAMPAGELACMAPPADAVPVVVLDDNADGMVRAYGTVKQLALGFGYTRFALVARGASEGSKAQHSRLAAAARTFLNAEVTLAGRLPGTDLNAAPVMAQLARTLLHTATTPLVLH